MRIAEFEFVETITVRRYEELIDEVEQRHAGEVSIWKETSQENGNSLIKDMRVAKADIVKIPV